MIKKLMMLSVALISAVCVQAAVSVTNVKAVQRYPWNGLVDIDYTVVCDDANANVYVFPEGTDNDVVAVISKAAAKKSAVLKSARLMAAPPVHQLSENALKPEEVVNVYANSNGVWSISLNCTESYTTADEDEIVFNRFELTDAGNDDGAPRFQNNNTICDVDTVTVSGTLPTTMDDDGNLVCEGKRYVVQLTVSSSENEDSVTTCVLDVRSATDEVDGEDEDEDDSNEPKSCDPNEMVGPEGLGSNRLVKPGEWMTYTIYFENKADAEAAAASVTVTNPLSDAFDWSTFEMLDVGFGSQVDTGLSGKHEGVSEQVMEGTNTSVRTELTVDETTGVAEWYLRIVDPNGDAEGWPHDVYAGFLPPNDPETYRGKGHLTYRIKLRDDAPYGVVVTNSASIVFDYNEPIETDPAWWNTVGVPGAGFGKSEISVEEGEYLTFTVSGGAEDNVSSVKLYLTYNTAAAADLDIANGMIVDSFGVPSVSSDKFKFPQTTLTWAAGEIGEKTITILVKSDKAIEDAEQFTFQLADPVGMELGEMRLCTVTITDPGYAELETKIAAGTATKAEKTAWDKLQKAKAPYIRGVADPANAGKVTGSGLCALGKKVTLKATANKGYVFTGWLKSQIALDGDRLVIDAVDYVATTPSLVIDRTAKPAKDTATSTTLTNVNENATFYATFITTDEDKAAVGLTLNGGEVSQSEDSVPSLTTNIMCGVALNWPLASSALSATTVKVAGLPAGLKFTAKDIMKKGSKTEVEIPANTIYGAPTAASKIDKKTGLPVPSAVKVTVTTAGKSSVTYLMNITVDALPDWAVGNFEGFVSLDENDGGFATMSITAAGKVSGKIAYGGTNWTFKANSYDITSETVGSTNFIVETVAVSGKATRKLWMTITDIGRDYLPDSAVAFVDGNFGDMLTEMHRLPWKDKGDAAAAALVASYAGAYSCTVPYGEDAGDVTFVLDEKGAVKGTVVLPDGTKKRKATFSSNALTGDNSLSVVIALPPDAKKGYPAVFKVVNLVNHSGEGADNLAFRDPGVVAAVAELTAESGATGKVSVNPKYGQVASGKDVTLTAKAAKGSVFHRWEITGVDTEGLDLSSATLKFKMADAGDVFATAVFVTAEEDAASIALSVDALGGEISPEAIISVTNTCGVALKWSVAADALSQPVVAVSGLPSGLKFTAKDIMKKGSKTEVEIPANTIYGAPTAASKIDKKTGLPVPSAVKVTVTTAGKSSVTYLMNITVDALPDWAVGNFEGFVRYDENDGGLATMSVTAAGKISGKISYGGTNWTFKADSFAVVSETVGYTNLALRTVATSGKATLDLSLNMVDFFVDSLPSSTTSFAEGYFGEIYTMMHRLPWKDKNDADAASLVASYAGAYSCTVPYGEDAGDVTFVLDEKGAVKGTVVLPDGTKKRKATFSCNVLPNYDSLSVVIALPPDAKKGYPAVFKVVNLVNHSGEGADNLAFRDPGGVQLWEGGPYWAECNVGATKPEEYGYYFWWGDTVGYARNASNNGWVSSQTGASFCFSYGNCPTCHYYMDTAQLQSAGYIDATGNLVAKYDAATAHLGTPWRMPTGAEFAALVKNCTTTWTRRNGVYGRLVRGKGAFSTKSIFLPAAGAGYNSDLYNPGSGGCYWSSTPDSGDSDFAAGLSLSSDDFYWCYIAYRYNGSPVRPLRGFAK